MSKTLDETLTEIARKHLFVETLETRNSDSLDFHDCSAAGIKAALEAAYEAGKAATRSPLSPTERKQAADLLRHASETFATHGCNDHPLPNTPEHRKLYNAIVAWNGDDQMPKAETHTKTLWFMDWMVMDFLADKLEGKA